MASEHDSESVERPADARHKLQSKLEEARRLNESLHKACEDLDLETVLAKVDEDMAWDAADGMDSTPSPVKNGEWLGFPSRDTAIRADRLNTLRVNHKSPQAFFEIHEDDSVGPWKSELIARVAVPNIGIIEDRSGLKITYRDCLGLLLDWIREQDLIYGCQMSLWNQSILKALEGKNCQIILQYEEWMFDAIGNDSHPMSRRLRSVYGPYSRIGCAQDIVPSSPNFPNSFRREDGELTRGAAPGIYLFKENPSTSRRYIDGAYKNTTERLLHHKFFIGRSLEYEYDDIHPSDLDAHSIAYGTFNCSEASRGNLESLMIMPASSFPELYGSLRREFLAIKSSVCTFSDWKTFRRYAALGQWPMTEH